MISFRNRQSCLHNVVHFGKMYAICNRFVLDISLIMSFVLDVIDFFKKKGIPLQKMLFLYIVVYIGFASNWENVKNVIL